MQAGKQTRLRGGDAPARGPCSAGRWAFQAPHLLSHCISQHRWDGARMFRGPSMHKSTPSLPVSHFWALAALDPCSPGATGTLQQLNEMQLLEQPLLNLFVRGTRLLVPVHVAHLNGTSRTSPPNCSCVFFSPPPLFSQATRQGWISLRLHVHPTGFPATTQGRSLTWYKHPSSGMAGHA